MRKRNRAQISIFIIISVLILFLIIFLIVSKNSFKADEILSDISETNDLTSDFFQLKDTIDLCLETELKRALIVAGLRGGLIYDEGEVYASSNGVFEYDLSFLSNLDLESNYLSKSLVQSKSGVFMPSFDSKVIYTSDLGDEVIYSHSIEEDFKRFILKGMGQCINFESLKNDGYIFHLKKFGGMISEFDSSSNTIVISGMDASVGDRINFDFEGKSYTGIVNSVGGDRVEASLYFGSGNFESSTLLNGISVINLNNAGNVSVDFLDTGVVGKFEYPIVLEKDGRSIAFSDSEVFVDINFKRMLNIAKVLLDGKSFNRSLDYSKSEDINYVLSDLEYLKGDELANFNFVRTIVNNTEDFKLYTYSLIDKNSLIFSSPFVFNFGYENSAPVIDKNEVYNIETVTLELVGTKNTWTTFNLRDYTKDAQEFDNYFFYFVPKSYDSTQFSYSIDSSGVLEFIGREDKKFFFEILVTDGETVRVYPVEMKVGTGELGDELLSNGFDFLEYKAGTEYEFDYDYFNGVLSVSGSSASLDGSVLVPYDFNVLVTGSSDNLSFDGQNSTLPSIWRSMVRSAGEMIYDKVQNRGGVDLNNLSFISNKFYPFEINYSYDILEVSDNLIRTELSVFSKNEYSVGKEDFNITFIYENFAPKFNLTNLNSDEVLGNVAIFNLGVNESIDLDLSVGVLDKLPNNQSDKYKFNGDVSVNSNSVEYSLNSDGGFHFIGFENSTSYEIPFNVTDYELESDEFILRLVVG